MPVRVLLLAALLLVLTHGKAFAADNSLLGISFPTGPGAKSASVPMQIVLLLTGLTLLPAIIMCVTPFLRITLVLHFLRQALATQTVPSNQILVGLSLFLTLVIMNPVLREIYTTAWQPMEAGKLSFEQAADQGSKPLKRFLLRFARDKDIQLFIELSHSPRPANANDVSLTVLVPAYIISELRTGFQIGTVLYLPFLVVDLVVASITLSIGMMQLPPVMISAPFKILLFVLVDGWNLVVGSLIRSFG
ncbi:MAG TPA: flagellar type III secretion system pore protein FliP [Bryobacteraceae bacterium]|nr:flagellar type III secretion system pore protein FliP [Bryobacteraceae bacterium]